MLLEEFTTLIRSDIRNFDKEQRQAFKEDPEEFSLDKDLKDWISLFSEFIA